MKPDNNTFAAKKLDKEELALIWFNGQWLYFVMAVGLLGALLDFLGLEVGESFMMSSCYMLLVSPLIRNLIRTYFKTRSGDYKTMVLLILPILVFSILVIRV